MFLQTVWYIGGSYPWILGWKTQDCGCFDFIQYYDLYSHRNVATDQSKLQPYMLTAN